MERELMTVQARERLDHRARRGACLVHIYPPGPSIGSRHDLGEARLTFGREDDCDVTVDDFSVSRRHARIDPAPGGGYLVTDLGSTNGTYVNDVPADRSPLRDGDYLRVGNCLFRFLDAGNLEAVYHEELYRLAIIDALTDLPNKRHLLDSMERELARSARRKRPLGLILLDVDHFKAINDTLGHLAGDRTLQELASRLRGLVRRDELLARYGGEEFAAVLPDATLDEAIRAAERFRMAIEEPPFLLEGKPRRVTISLGVAWTPGGEAIEPAELIRQADERLYRAKREGRNRVVS